MIRREKGLSLIELVVTISILAVSLTGITFMIQGGMSRSADTLLEVRSVALAQAYLDEILSKRFDEESQANGIPPCRSLGGGPKPCTDEGSFGSDGETRAIYDDVDDYHGLAEGDGEAFGLRDAQGMARSGYDNFHVAITVRYINLAGQDGEEEDGLAQGSELNNQFDAKLITVSVSHRTQSQALQFSAYKSNF